ncbi:DUF2470 domain-containing protein [Mycena venus]|uniref:DUF2470 domain-containing protein n=1 Tax=Mycena venus TaxID=2733690 RepID=A0A8H6WT15_9AGAR|nr:DUF2470 domain-containing protein [Mycena venus]
MSSDPVAEKSGFLKMYMSSHPDTLVAYAKWYGKVAEPITSAEMSAIDTKSMTLTCALKDGSKKVVVVAIDPPLKGYDDVKPRLLEMKALSQEGLGMIKSPRITSFQFPKNGLYPALFLYTVIPYGAFAPSTGGSPLLLPAQFLRSYVSPTPFKFVWWITVVAHMLEGLYTLSLCWRHKAPFGVSVAYFITTFFIGGPTWMGLRKRIQNARIDSVMKVE